MGIMKRRIQFNGNSFATNHKFYAMGAAMVFLGVGAAGIVSTALADEAGALTYQKSVDVGFTIERSVSIELDSSTLKIEDLSPGQSADSNIVTLTVKTNNATGYTIGSTVGGTHNGNTFTTSNLQHSTDYDSTKALTYFQSLSTDAEVDDLASLDAGKWGYAFNLNNTGWQPYSGLPLDGGTESAELVDVDSNVDSSIQFKIAAKAQDMQYSGEYNNVVNFTAVVKDPITTTYMQDLTSSTIATLLPNVGSTTTAVDKRDNKEYTIAKLADNKYWMTTNLNLAGGTTLNASDSNVPSDNYYTLPASTAITSGTSVPSDQFSNDSTAYVFNTGNNTTTCNSSTPCNSYYSWLAATAGGKDSSGAAVTTNGYNAAYSICPKGWRLPTSTTSNAAATTSPNWKTGDWYALMTAYGANLESNYYQSGSSAFYDNAGPGTTPNFLLAGRYGSGSFYYGGSYGVYWSATSFSSSYGYGGYFDSSSVGSAGGNSRRYGYSVRCLFAE